MSRKKTVKGKAAGSSPSAGSPAGKWTGKAPRNSPGIVPMNGVVHPSRPSVSCSSEFYDIAFKVRRVEGERPAPPPASMPFSLITPAAGSTSVNIRSITATQPPHAPSLLVPGTSSSRGRSWGSSRWGHGSTSSASLAPPDDQVVL